LIVALCEELLAECPTDRGPSPLAVLGSCRGVRDVQYQLIEPEAGCSGLLIPRDGGYVIVISRAEPEGRRFFSVGHEIVHTWFREVCPSATASFEEERLCDLGAAALTMPAARFGPFLAARQLSLTAIDACRREFAVSATAAGRRAMELTDVSACLFGGEMARTLKQIRSGTGTPELRIRKWWQSARWPFNDGHLNLPVAPESVIGQAFVHQDHRTGLGNLGIPFRAGVFEIDARGQSYPPGAGDRRVLALARGPLG
jgi:Zn-dependent peptidase ImmA (M78 family)